jgi:hypothetical protein
VVSALMLLGRRDDRSAQQPPVPERTDPQDEPAQDRAARIAQALRDLELADRRAAAIATLADLRPESTAALRRAIDVEQTRGRRDVLDALRTTLALLDPRDRLAAFGLRAD